MHTLGIRDVGLLFVVGTVTALFGPILIEMIADRYSLTRTALLGKKWSVDDIENAGPPIFAMRLGALALLEGEIAATRKFGPAISHQREAIEI